MPSLTPEDRKHMLGPLARACPSCHDTLIRHYCRSCDQFYLSCRCTEPAENTHRAHRIYQWTPSGIVALPDFDNLVPR